MEWVRENWIYIAIFIFIIAMNYFGFGCCGRHGKHRGHGNSEEAEHKGQSTHESKEHKGGYGCH